LASSSPGGTETGLGGTDAVEGFALLGGACFVECSSKVDFVEDVAALGAADFLAPFATVAEAFAAVATVVGGTGAVFFGEFVFLAASFTPSLVFAFLAGREGGLSSLSRFSSSRSLSIREITSESLDSDQTRKIRLRSPWPVS
jgi:hypothetical protein